MKNILLWDDRKPSADPLRLEVDDVVASAALRAGVAAAADPADAGALGAGSAIGPSGPVDVILLPADARGGVRATLPLLVAMSAIARGVAVLPEGRSSYIAPAIVPIGDSRVPWALDPSTGRQKGATDMTNVACALANQRYRTIGGFGQSGKRSDEYLQQLAAALALKPAVIFTNSILNNLGQSVAGYTHATRGITVNDANVVAVSTEDIRGMASTAIAAGAIVIVASEMAQTNMAQSLLDKANAYNANIRALARTMPGLVFLDLRPALCDVNNRLRADLAYDIGHLNQRGALIAGGLLKTVLDTLIPNGPTFLLGADGLPEVGGYAQLLPNPLFNVTTGGGTTTGATGSFAGSCSFNKTGAGAALAVTSAPQSVMLNCTFGAQGDSCRMAQDVPLANWNSGDIVRAMALVSISNPVNFAGAELTLVANGDSASRTWSDMTTTATFAGADGSYQMLMLTQEYTIPAYTTKGFLAATIINRAFGAGGANVEVKQIGVLKKIV